MEALWVWERKKEIPPPLLKILVFLRVFGRAGVHLWLIREGVCAPQGGVYAGCMRGVCGCMRATGAPRNVPNMVVLAHCCSVCAATASTLYNTRRGMENVAPG